MDIFEEIVRLGRLGQKCALATIVQVRGSIPSFESAKLLVREDGSLVGTIGGGCVEAEAGSLLDLEADQLLVDLGLDQLTAPPDQGIVQRGNPFIFACH